MNSIRKLFERHVGNLQPVGSNGEYKGHCPFHDDQHPSFSVDLDSGLWICHAGCGKGDAASFAQRIGIDSRLFCKGADDQNPAYLIQVAAYDYRDEDDQLLYQVVRYEPKTFRQRRPDGNGGWIYNLHKVRRILYGLPQLIEHSSQPVYIVEGEKDVDALRCIGIPTATTCPGGAGKWRDEYSKVLTGRKVTILPDNDESGQRHAQDVAHLLLSVGCEVRIVDLPGLPPKGDISDWIRAGGTKDELVRIVQSTPVWKPNEVKQAVSTPENLEAWLQGNVEIPFEEVVGLCANLDLFMYERSRKRIAGKLKVRVSSLDESVKGLIENENQSRVAGDALMWEDAVPWPEPVDGSELLRELKAALVQFVILPEGAAEAIVLWILHSHTHEESYISPFLAVISPEKRCGKTLTLQLIGELVPRPLLASNISPSAVFRSVEAWSPTLLIDEADTFLRRGNDELRGILNSGHTRATAYVVRSVPKADDFEPRRFCTWCPKVIAMIGELPGTLTDRSIIVRMHRRAPEETVKRFRLVRLEEFKILNRKAVRWASDHHHDLVDADPDVPDSLHDRAADNWRSLLAIADRVGGNWPRRARQAAQLLSGDTASESDSVKVQLLEDIRFVFRNHGDPDTIPTATLLESLHGMEDHPWIEWRHGKSMSAKSLAALLRPFNIKPKTIRFPDGPSKGYELLSLEDAFMRYLPNQCVTNVTTMKYMDLEKDSPVTEAEGVTDLTIHNSNDNREVTDVTGRNRRIYKGQLKPAFLGTERYVDCSKCRYFNPSPQDPEIEAGKCLLDAPFTGEDMDPPKPGRLRYCRQFVSKSAPDSGIPPSGPGEMRGMA